MKSIKDIVNESNATKTNKKPNGFCLLKPGFDEHEKEFYNILNQNGWRVLDKRRVLLTPDQVSALYVDLEKEPYYGELCDYMSSGDCICCSCYKECEKPVDEMCSLKKKIREKWGIDEMKNAMHCSDSEDNVVRECNICMNECSETFCSDNTYNNIIEQLEDFRDNNVPVEEGLFKAIIGGAAGMTIAPTIMKALCSILGIDIRGQFGSVLTSRLVLTALCTKMGWDK